tara:strand:- start:2272 stop:4020 length:1749 start_codon:yes stop_codon:yes gene_type:complete
LLDVTIRDFSGGWNVVDNDLNMKTKFAKILKNLQLGEDGSVEVRQGTKRFADLEGLTTGIVASTYYNNHIVVVGEDGVVVMIDDSGNPHALFNDEFAKNLPGAPDGWDATPFASFAEFNGELIICNGINKPLIVNTSMNCTYLNDPATGSNAYTPIAKYVVAHDRYLVMGGNIDNPDRLYISSTDTSGVFVGDAGPNDAVNVDLGSRVPKGSSNIKGLGRFRDKIMIAFENAILIGSLGTFDSGDHVPTFNDVIEEHGALSHRVMATIGEDMIFCDNVGVSSTNKALYTGAVRSERLSQLIDPEIHKNLARFTNTSDLENRTFAIYNSLLQSYMLFIPDEGHSLQQTETRCFVYRRIKALKINAWFEYTNWNWTSSCVSALKRVFFTKGTDVFILGNEQDPIYKDRMGVEEMFDDSTSFTDSTGWNPVADVATSGVPIPFVWELPWSDNQQRFNTKASRYINLDTDGNERFDVKMFVDNLYVSRSDLGETFIDESVFDDELGWDVDVLDPTLSMTFVGGDGPGYGSDEYGQYMGGGRPTRHEGLYAWTTKYKLFKLRLEGEAKGPLKFISITMAYQPGSIRR